MERVIERVVAEELPSVLMEVMLALGPELTQRLQQVLRPAIAQAVADTVAREIPADEPALDTVTSGCMAQLGLKFFVGMEPSEADRDRARAELARVGCAALAERPFGVLSQGERQKVMVARALVADPLLLVFDEPCDGMDPGARERFLDWLGDHLHEAGAPAVILVTHHVEEILPAFGKTLVLREGRVLAVGTLEECASWGPHTVDRRFEIGRAHV